MRKRNVVVAGGIAVAIAGLTASIAVATIPDRITGVIHGCRSLKNGTVRVIDVEAGQQCSRTEQALNWSGDTRRAFVVSQGASGRIDLSASPTTLMSVTVPTIAEGVYLLTAAIQVHYDSGVGAKITCKAFGTVNGDRGSSAWESSDSVTVGSGDKGDKTLQLQTVALTARDYNTDEWAPIVVRCTGTAPEGEYVGIGDHNIALIPIPNR
jgi:hypothetical protein